MTTRARVVILSAAALAVAFFAFDVHEGRRQVTFWHACWSIRRGEAADDAARALRDVGGEEYSQPTPDSGTRVWHLDGPLWKRLSICAVTIDNHGVVLGSLAKGDRPK
jgi:hypothetical protein